MLKTTTSAVLLLLFAGSAVAQDNRASRPGKVVSQVHQPVGTPHKASAFAPRPTNKRVFGAPIQAPIVHSAPAPK